MSIEANANIEPDVTATDAHQQWRASDTVTRRMELYNNLLYFTNHGLWYVRWITVDVAEQDGRLVATPLDVVLKGEEEGIDVSVVRCYARACGTQQAEFCIRATKRLRRRPWYCRACERARKTKAQRARRQGIRRMRPSCVRCGAIVAASRSTRRYCSTRCRVAANRARRQGRL
jgi:hypothetical protein